MRNVSASRRVLLLLLAFLAAVLLPVTAAAGPASAQDVITTYPDSHSIRDDAPVRDLVGVKLLRAWPVPGYSMWLPPRQGRLEFAEKIDASTLTLTLEPVGDAPVPEEQLSRLTKGVGTVVLFRFPVLSGPAEYLLRYSGTDAAGKPVSGAIPFALEDQFVAPGGGNHRHESDQAHRDDPAQVLLRAGFVWAAALAFLSVWRARRGRRSFSELVLPRLAGLLLAAVSGVKAFTLLFEAVEGAGESPLLEAVASPGLWLFLPLAAVGLLQVVAGRRDFPVAVAAAFGLVAVVVSTSHATGFWGAAQSVGYALVLIAVAVCLAAVVDLATRITVPGGADVPRVAAAAAVSALAAVALALLMVVLHAHGFEIRGDFAADLTGRLRAAGVALLGLSGLGGLSFVPGRWWARAAAWPLAVLVSAAVTYLLWLPPPTSGL